MRLSVLFTERHADARLLRDDRNDTDPAAASDVVVVVVVAAGVCALAARSRNSDVVVYQPKLTASYTPDDITCIINFTSLFSSRVFRAKRTRSDRTTGKLSSVMHVEVRVDLHAAKFS